MSNIVLLYFVIVTLVTVLHFPEISSWGVLDTELESPLNLGACDRYLHNIEQRHIKIINPPKLKGVWVSSSCEIRPGAEYIIRKYQFINDTYFRILQFYYTDPSCTYPFYGLEAKGILKMTDQNNMNNHLLQWRPSSVELFSPPTLFQVSVMPYTQPAARYLQNIVSISSSLCQRKFNVHNWRPSDGPYDILSFVEYNRQILQDYDCTSRLGFNLHEFQLIRVEHRTAGPSVLKHLHLGDIATSFAERQRHRPSSFQEPLQEVHNIHCKECFRIIDSTLKNPPIIDLKATLTSYPNGEWVSIACESRPNGNYVTRRLVFEDDVHHTWSGTYNHFHDPLCRQPFFSFTARGNVEVQGLYKKNEEARMFNFNIAGLSITPRDKKSLKQLNSYRGYGCGTKLWEMNITQDVTNTNGCDHLRLEVPTKSEQVMSTELKRSQMWLYVGSIPNSHQLIAERPTSYQPPLVKCREIPMPKIFRGNQNGNIQWNRNIAISDVHSSEYKAGGSIHTLSLTFSAYLRQALLLLPTVLLYLAL